MKTIKQAARLVSYYIGRLSKRYRKRYWVIHGGSYMWGLNRFIQDEFEPIQIHSSLSETDFEDILNQLKK